MSTLSIAELEQMMVIANCPRQEESIINALETARPGSHYYWYIYRHVTLGFPVQWRDACVFSDFAHYSCYQGVTLLKDDENYSDSLWRAAVVKFVNKYMDIDNKVSAVSMLLSSVDVGRDFGVESRDREADVAFGEMLFPLLDVGLDFGVSAKIPIVRKDNFPGLYRLALKDFRADGHTRSAWTVYIGCGSCVGLAMRFNSIRDLRPSGIRLQGLCIDCIISLFRTVNISQCCGDWSENVRAHVLDYISSVTSRFELDSTFVFVITRHGAVNVQFAMHDRDPGLINETGDPELDIVVSIMNKLAFTRHDLRGWRSDYDMFDVFVQFNPMHFWIEEYDSVDASQIPGEYMLIWDSISNHVCGSDNCCELARGFANNKVTRYDMSYGLGGELTLFAVDPFAVSPW